jgi:hypothetical protein
MTDLMDSATLRRWAMQCGAQADNPRTSGDERERLLKMQTALLDLAQTQDWLEGQNRGQGRDQSQDLRPTA